VTEKKITEDIAKKKYTFPGENPVVSKSDADDTTGTDDGDSADNDTNDSDNAGGTDNTDGTDTTDTEGEIDIEDTDNLIGGDDAGTAIRNNATTAGTQMNPYVYRGENIEEHPYYKYTLLGDLEYVKQQAENNKGTSKRKDGDITLEDGQYWYWTEESTDNGDEADADSETETGTGSRGCQDEQDWCKSTDRFYKDRPDITELNALVYEQTDDQGIKYGDNSSFCRRSNTCVDTSENDDRA